MDPNAERAMQQAERMMGRPVSPTRFIVNMTPLEAEQACAEFHRDLERIRALPFTYNHPCIEENC